MAVSCMQAVFLIHLTQMVSQIIDLSALVWMLISKGLVLQVYDLKGENLHGWRVKLVSIQFLVTGKFMSN